MYYNIYILHVGSKELSSDSIYICIVLILTSFHDAFTTHFYYKEQAAWVLDIIAMCMVYDQCIVHVMNFLTLIRA